MRIWLVTIGEPLPTDGAGTRLLRTGILASRLAARGHDVFWWTSAFDHNRKTRRVHADSTVQLGPNVTARLLSSPIGYKRNISVARLANHYHLALKFRRQAEGEAVPDIILSSLPTAELSLEAVRYGRRRGIPVVLDARDMWPDLLIEAIPRALRWMARPVIAHLQQVIGEACRGATAILGITPAFVQWGLGYAGRLPSAQDIAFPLSNDTAAQPSLLAEAARFWLDRGIGLSSAEFNVCFFGNIGSAEKYEWQYVIDAAAEFERSRLPIRFVLCGDGDGLADLERAAGGCGNIVFGGWIDAPRITALMHLSQAGLLPYRNRRDFVASYPNKAIEYLSAGLPVVSSLDGEIGKLLCQHRAGIVYRSASDLVQEIRRIYEDRATLRRLSDNARALYAQEFAADKVYGAFAAHLEALAKTGMTPSGKHSGGGSPTASSTAIERVPE